MEVTTFACSICGEASHRICAFCTKDACGNHLCQRCLRCSDCCLCESPSSSEDEEPVANHESLNGVTLLAPRPNGALVTTDLMNRLRDEDK